MPHKDDRIGLRLSRDLRERLESYGPHLSENIRTALENYDALLRQARADLRETIPRERLGYLAAVFQAQPMGLTQLMDADLGELYRSSLLRDGVTVPETFCNILSGLDLLPRVALYRSLRHWDPASGTDPLAD